MCVCGGVWVCAWWVGVVWGVVWMGDVWVGIGSVGVRCSVIVLLYTFLLCCKNLGG